ncbi:hypothetical protein AKJ08_0582 [Vulgatibacter incomptus]|uniref:Uncharacterized protein n=2 Tax=Vulgatibacter incomptus TaxID=1391653 RepID=A0A0K1P9J4_9BACT|nr:hypothetical protein AKJ08_0582 [Vulgatibacter incomptus]
MAALAAGLLIASPAAAALDADVVLIYGSSWKRTLPAYAASAKPASKGSGAAATLPPVLLWTGGEERWTEELLQRLKPKKVVWIGPPGSSSASLKIPGKVQRIEAPDEELGAALAKAAFGPASKAPAVYVADGTDFSAALAAAALAAADSAPLLIASGDLPATVREAGELARHLGAKEVVFVGTGDETRLASASGGRVRVLSGDDALKAYNDRVASARHLVVAAPSDAEGPFSPPRLSVGALPYVLGKGAALAYVGAGPGGGRSPEQAATALEATGKGPFDAVTIVGDHIAVPMGQMEDIDQVAKGADSPRVHKIPSFVTRQGLAADRAVGRLAALDVFDLSRWIARILHGVSDKTDGNGALILANADRKFVLGEAISRTTSSELANSGVKVESYYREEITPELIRKELPGHGLVLWEGHPRDLTLDDDALPAPESPLPPATYFLQGCYTLDRSDPYLLVERGANAVIGTYMAVYSASGSGFARAYLNAQLHGGETAGEALASARNYLLATVELKKRRGHADWRKTLRAALSFDLWGDPTAKLPVQASQPRKAPVRATVANHQITVQIPAERLPTAVASDYMAEIRPGAQLSALYDNVDADASRRLVELFFVEVEVPKELGDDPQVTAAYDPSTYAWVFAPRTRKLSLLIHEAALPRGGKGAATLRFGLTKAE